jgi:hypothetical protein
MRDSECKRFDSVVPEKQRHKEKPMSTATIQDWQHELSSSERELLREVALALRGIRYGSVVLTVHDGRIVELNKTERIRKTPA